MEIYSFKDKDNLKKIQQSGPQKAGKILIALGKENAAKVARYLEPELLEKIAKEICNIGPISVNEQKAILDDFLSNFDPNSIPARGGAPFAEEVLVSAFGQEKANAILDSVAKKDSKAMFEQISRTDPDILATIIQTEHPQVICQVLAHCQPNAAAMVFKKLPNDIQPDLAKRLAKMNKSKPEDIYRIAELMLQKITAHYGQENLNKAGGMETLLNILQHADSATEKNILAELEKFNPDMAQNIKIKLVTFESLLDLSNHEIRMILSRISDDRLLSDALRGAEDNLKRHFLSNISRNRATDILHTWDDQEQISIKDIEKAREEILRIAQILDNKGDIVLRKSKEEWVE